MKKYMDTTTDRIQQLVNTHEKQKKIFSISKESNQFANKLDIMPKK